MVERDKLCTLTAAEAARRIARRELTSEALVAACLDRISDREPSLQAWAHVDAELALQQARRLDREEPRSPLHGVPVGIKDVLDTCDMPTGNGSSIYKGYRPKADAACVAILRRAGCVILGKTVTTEFANAHPSGTRNPHNLAHTPGGSSSGSAAAVADHMVPLALGTQTGGSVIRPASFCGVVGYKPTFGMVNRSGLKFGSESIDTIGGFSRSVEDMRLLLHILASVPPATSNALENYSPRVGIFRTPLWREVDEDAQKNFEQAIAMIESTGARLLEFDFPAYEGLSTVHSNIMWFEVARALGWELAHHADQLSSTLRPRVEEGWNVPRATYDAARHDAQRARTDLSDRMRDVDFLLMPATPGEAPAGYASTGSSIFNRIWSLLGVPAVVLPSGVGARQLPLGIQLVGHCDGDDALLNWAAWVEKKLIGK